MSDHQCGRRIIQPAVGSEEVKPTCRGFTLRDTDVHPGKPHKCRLDDGHVGRCLCEFCDELFVDPDVAADQTARAEGDCDCCEPTPATIASAGLIAVAAMVVLLAGIVLCVQSCLGRLP